MPNSEGFQHRFRIGFYPGPHQIRMEEEEGREDDNLRYGQAEVIDKLQVKRLPNCCSSEQPLSVPWMYRNFRLMKNSSLWRILVR
jgi:hypothetical protein